MFSFDFVRSEVDVASNQIVQKVVTASVPLLTLINLPAIAIEEATIDMDLQLVAHEETKTADGNPGPLKLFVVPGKKQLLRTSDSALAVDSAGTIKLHVVMRHQNPLGLEKIKALLDSGSHESTAGS